MAKKTKKTASEDTKKGLDVKVKLDITKQGRLTATVTLLQDGVEVASDSDWTFVKFNG